MVKSDVKSRPQPTEEPPAPGHVRWLLIVTAVVIGSLWLIPLFSAADLWVDELGTWWVVEDGLGDTVHRALTFHGQSPLYYSIIWVARVVGGNSEVVLRLPSLIATAVSVVLLYRLTRSLIGREAAWFAVLVFAATQAVAFEASEARPYALATLAVVLASPPTRSFGGSMTGAAGLSPSCTPCSPSRSCGCTTSTRSSSCPKPCTRSSDGDAGRPRCPFADCLRSR